jgi:hypothetical protein
MREKVEGLGDAFLTLGDVDDMFDELISGILAGTQDIGGILGDAGQAIGTKFFSSILVGKKANLDQPLIGNISGLVGGPTGGILGNLFAQGGSVAGSLFGDAANAGILSYTSAFDTTVGPALSAANVAWQKAGTTAGGIFGKGLIGSVNSFLGNLPGVGGLFSGITDLGVSLGGKLAGAIGGGLGSTLGNVLTSVINPVGLLAGAAFAIKAHRKHQVKTSRAPPVQSGYASHDEHLSCLSKESANGKNANIFGEGSRKIPVCFPRSQWFLNEPSACPSGQISCGHDIGMLSIPTPLTHKLRAPAIRWI